MDPSQSYGHGGDHSDSESTEPDIDGSRIDPELRLRTFRTAASTIAESIRQEDKIERRRKSRKLGLRKTLKGKGTWKISLRKRKDGSIIHESGEGMGDTTVPEDEGAGNERPTSMATTTQVGQGHQRTASAGVASIRGTGAVGRRRNIYVNLPLPPNELNASGEPIVRFTRNKVRTTKYTPLTFVPKNLFEQFRRLANLYFLFLVIIQVWPLFGAAGASISWLPLAIILAATAIKDGVEDWQRAKVDEGVNNSGCVRLVFSSGTGEGGLVVGRRGNPNHPRDGRSWWMRMLGIGEPANGVGGSVSRGVRKLRGREGELEDFQFDFRSSDGNGFFESDREGEAVMMTDEPSFGEGYRTKMGDSVHKKGSLSLSKTSKASFSASETATSSATRGRTTSLFSSTSSHNLHAHHNPSSINVDMHSYPPFYKSSTTLLGAQSTYKPSTVSLGGPSASQLNITNREENRGRNTGPIWERTLWKKLLVGDIVLLRENESIPADIVVLSVPTLLPSTTSSSLDSSASSAPAPSSSPSTDSGICFVETKNLDGETNLKPRRALKCTSSVDPRLLASGEWGFRVNTEAPNANIYGYNGTFHYRLPGQSSLLREDGIGAEEQGEFVEPITANELLLRGCTLRNTPFVIGLVVSTGSDTKIMLNQGLTPLKRAKIERETNFNVSANFVILMVLCLVTAIVSGIFLDKSKASRVFFEAGSEPSGSVIVNSIITFGSSLIAFQNIVPIALFISIEIVKTIQAYFIHQDVDMVYENGDLHTTCVPKTWNISDDLGQIEYIFSDKTGTLTQNVMSFLRCSVLGPGGGEGVGAVEGGMYGEGVSEAQRGKGVKEGGNNRNSSANRRVSVDDVDVEEQRERIERSKMEMIDLMKQSWKNRYLDEGALTLVSPKLARELSSKESVQKERLVSFFRALALCHTVLPSHSTDSMGRNRVIYKAESPDEAALVSCARDVGCVFVSKNPSSVEIEVLGVTERYTPLRVLEFNSTRKRMSVILRNAEGQIVLYCKGADSVIYERLSPRHDPIVKQHTAQNLEQFANEGLRTLCVAKRIISEDEYAMWAMEHEEAAAATEDREEKIDAVSEKIEKGLHILGATALEDKLQEGVPEAIELLHTAGIKLWILTGDKLQTAIEIGYSCNLLKHEMEIMILQSDSVERTRALIEAGLNKIASARGPLLSSKFGIPVKPHPKMGNDNSGYAIVIDGETLSYALDPSIKPLFLSLGEQCDTVVCCRVSPAQKAMTVKLVKEGRQAMTLAIGDGANDVAMIQEANIGCGLFGLEGAQAAMSADYAFGQFRFLTKLLLVHGRWSYIRVADLHKNFFYKNVIWTFALFWFMFYNSFDATYLYDYTFILLYNVLFTSLPVIALGAFDQDLNAKAAFAFPQLYRDGIKGVEYTKLKFWAYMLDGFYQSAVIFFIPYLAWQVGDVAASWSGHDLSSLGDFGTTASVAAIFAANQYVGINTRYWTIITWIIIYGSTLVMMIWIAIYSAFPSANFVDEVVILFGSVQFWTTLLLSVVIAVGPRFLYKSIQQAYYPKDRDIIREMWVSGDLKDRLGIAHRKARKRRGTKSHIDQKGSGDLEMVSMFEHAHARSASELSNWDHGDSPRGAYMPTGTDTPNNGTPRRQPHDERFLSPISTPNEDRNQYLNANSPYMDASRTPLPQYTAPPSPNSPSFSYYSAGDIPSNSVTPVSPTTPRLSTLMQSNNPYLRSLSTSPVANSQLRPEPSHRHSLLTHQQQQATPTPPLIATNDEAVHSPTTSNFGNHTQSSRISTSGPGGSRWIDPPSQTEAQEYESQRINLQTPQMSEISSHAGYATADEGDSVRRPSEDTERVEEDDSDAGTIDDRTHRLHSSSLEIDTAALDVSYSRMSSRSRSNTIRANRPSESDHEPSHHVALAY